MGREGMDEQIYCSNSSGFGSDSVFTTHVLMRLCFKRVRGKMKLNDLGMQGSGQHVKQTVTFCFRCFPPRK